MAYRTLGDLRSELMARLGMGAQGASGASQVLMNSFLRNGQAQLYQAQDWKHLTQYAEKDLGVGQNLLDYPTACARDQRILCIDSYYSGQWRELKEGIDSEHWNTMDTLSYPFRFERFAQLLIYPKADQVYRVRFKFVADLARFEQDGDRASLDDEMILLHAVTNAKAHYRQPDASLYQGQLASLLASLRAKSFPSGPDAVVRRRSDEVIEPKPLVVGRDV
jgi:hypothetical protein